MKKTEEEEKQEGEKEKEMVYFLKNGYIMGMKTLKCQ